MAGNTLVYSCGIYDLGNNHGLGRSSQIWRKKISIWYVMLTIYYNIPLGNLLKCNHWAYNNSANRILKRTRTVRGTDYSPATAPSYEKDTLRTENRRNRKNENWEKEKWRNKGMNKQLQPDSGIHNTSAHCPHAYQVSTFKASQSWEKCDETF